MGKPLIIVGSITNALRSRDLLAWMGIRSYVERTPRSGPYGGCGYSIYVPGRADEAEKILRRHGIRVIGRAQRGGIS